MKEKSDPLSGLTPGRWRQIDRLLEEALDLEPERQQFFLDTACRGDPVLRDELVSLLAAHHRSAGVLDRSALDPVAGTLADAKLQSLVETQLCSYRILALVGSGGMGAVYQALDTRLDRTVALKILPEDVIHDTDRIRRFTTEAKAASSLNHPNICTVFELADCHGIRFITMEYVDGQTLSEIVGQRSLNWSEILEVAIQVADSLGAAHDRGIIHRDIKPGNVMMTARGQVKVLDFGIAKVRRPAATGVETTGTILTQEGVILGTVDYMSPEQVLGRDLDERTDIFSLGVVLYELATGQRPFSGNTPTETMDRILHAEPDSFHHWNRRVPGDLEGIIRRCLEKDPSRRYQSARALLRDLKDFRRRTTSDLAPWSGIRRRFTALAAVGLSATIVMVTAVWLMLPPLTPGFEAPLEVVPLTSYAGHERNPTFSPDGTQLAFSWSGHEFRGYFHIYIKQVGSEALSQLTHGEVVDNNPVWSPDGQRIAFLRERTLVDHLLLMKPSLGGMELSLAEIRFPVVLKGVNLAWHPAGKWLVTADAPVQGKPAALFAISRETGEKRRLTSPPTGSIGDGGPEFSADGRSLLFARHAGSHGSDVYLLALSDDLVPTGEPRRMTFDNRSRGPKWTPDGSEIVYVSGSRHASSLWRLDPKRPGEPRRLPVPGPCFSPALSGQGHLVYAQVRGNVNVYSAPLNNGVPVPRKLIFSNYVDHTPRFSPSGDRIAFSSYRSGAPEIWVSDRDGLNPPVQLTSFDGPETDLPAWSPDGRQIAFTSGEAGSSDIYVMSAQGGAQKRLTSEPFNEGGPCYSRDGTWIYFSSNPTGQTEIYKMPAEGGEMIRVTRNGGRSPLLSPDGDFVYYIKETGGESGSLWSMPVAGGDEREILPAVCGNAYAVLEKGIYFIPGSWPGYAIDFRDFETGEITRFLTLPRTSGGWGLDVSPDRQEILYTQFDGEGADLMLVENFR